MQEAAGYDESSVDSILAHASKLTGKSLSEVVHVPAGLVNKLNKGKLGELVERLYFKIKPPNDKDPDFPLAKLELKTTGVKLSKKAYIAKERLVLSQINPRTIRDEKWETSSFLKKCRFLLVLFYLYDRDISVEKRIFVISPLYLDLLNLTPSEVNQIAKDWEYIRRVCVENRFHELSEGHTTYLKACRKGSGGLDEYLVSQDPGAPSAKGRAFSFPTSFMTSHIQRHVAHGASMLIRQGQTVDDAARERLSPYFGRSVPSITEELGFKNRSKNRNYALIKTLLSGANVEPIELAKAGIKLRTVTLNARGVPKENIPFDAFAPLDLVDEDWFYSKAISDLQNRYLFAVFQETSQGRVFRTAGFWAMSNADIDSCREVWEETKNLYLQRKYDLPKRVDHRIMFVNTHGANSKDLVEALQGDAVTKRSFWLSKEYFVQAILPNLTF